MSSTLVSWHPVFSFAAKETVEAKYSCLEGMGNSPFCFGDSVFDLSPGATVNKVAMAMATGEAITYHVIEVYTAV